MLDLEFLQLVITAWPADCTSVRLDSDGEIAFEPVSDHDFYPDDLDTARAVFEPGEQCKDCGREYSHEEWRNARND